MNAFIPPIQGLFNGADPELILLDLDGTLIDSVPDLAAAVDKMLVELGLPEAGEDKVSLWVGNGSEMLVRRALVEGDEEQAQQLAASEVTKARSLFDRAYLAHLHQAKGAFQGVEDFLNGCTLPKMVITNKPRLFTLPLLRALGWEQYFVRVLCGDDLPEKKPSPMPLLHACQWQSVSAAQALMIGDSMNDIQAAKAAGMCSVAVTYGYNHGQNIEQSGADFLCDNLFNLLA